MTIMETNQFSLHFYTSVSLASSHLIELIQDIKSLFSLKQLPAVLCLDVDGRRPERSVSDLEDYLASPEFGTWRGRLNIFLKAAGLSGRWELLRLPAGSEDSHSDLVGRLGRYAHHEVVIEIDSQHRQDKKVVNGLFSLFARTGVTLMATFAIGQDVEHAYSKNIWSPGGLSVGLPDVYRFSMFGPEFVTIIGSKTLLDLPVYQVMQLSNGGIVIQLDAQIEARHDDFESFRTVLRSRIGNEFFTKPDNEQMFADGKMGWMSFVRDLWRARRALKDTSRFAAKRPIIDSSGLFVPSGTPTKGHVRK